MNNQQPRILFIHQGHEMYGSDRSLIRNIRATISKYPTAHISVMLPREGALTKAIHAEFDINIQIRALGVIRKYDLKRLNFNIIPRLLFFFRHIRYLNRFDIVYINSMVVMDCIMAARYTHAKVIVHNREIPEGMQRIVFSWLLNFSRATLVFVSKTAQNSFFGLKNQNQHVLWNGCRALHSGSESTEYRKDDHLRLVMIGRINKGKGQIILIQAISLLPENEQKRIKIRIVGDVYGKQQHLIKALHQQIRQLQMQDQVTLHPFAVDPAQHYHWSDILVVPSLLPESFGLVAIEAMSAGKPVIAANHGGLTEIVVHNETGILFEPGNPQALAEAISYALHNPQKMKQMGVAGKLRYEQHFTEEIYIRNFQKII